MILHGIEYQRPTSLNMRILADHVTYSFLAFPKSIFHFCLGCYCGGYSQNGRSNLSSLNQPAISEIWVMSSGNMWENRVTPNPNQGKQAMYTVCMHSILTLIARFTGLTWGPSGADRTQVGPMLAPWPLLSGNILGIQRSDFSDWVWNYQLE